MGFIYKRINLGYLYSTWLGDKDVWGGAVPNSTKSLGSAPQHSHAHDAAKQLCGDGKAVWGNNNRMGNAFKKNIYIEFALTINSHIDENRTKIHTNSHANLLQTTLKDEI